MTGNGISEEVRDIAEWLVESALGPAPEPDFLGLFCERLNRSGLPLIRLQLSWRTLHPVFEALSLCWSRSAGVQELQFHRHGSSDDPDNMDWQSSPLKYAIEQDMHFMRRRLTGPEAQLDFPVLSSFRDQGATDYLLQVIPFGPPPGIETSYDGAMISWCSDAADGFSDADISDVRYLARYLGLLLKLSIRDHISLNTLTAYLGEQTAKRVLSGKIRLGDGDRIPAVILYCDLRHSTRMAGQLSAPAYLKTLNRFFDCSAGAVIDAGGEVLRFIGDGILAIFRMAEGTCQQALAAALEVERRMTQLNRERRLAGLEPLSYGMGLHIGEVMHGNIGVPERLDFSVTGPAANEAARIEELTKSLGYRVLASGAFVDQASGDWVPLGGHTLRGTGAALDLFALASTRVPAAGKSPERC